MRKYSSTRLGKPCPNENQRPAPLLRGAHFRLCESTVRQSLEGFVRTKTNVPRRFCAGRTFAYAKVLFGKAWKALSERKPTSRAAFARGALSLMRKYCSAKPGRLCPNENQRPAPLLRGAHFLFILWVRSHSRFELHRTV